MALQLHAGSISSSPEYLPERDVEGVRLQGSMQWRFGSMRQAMDIKLATRLVGGLMMKDGPVKGSLCASLIELQAITAGWGHLQLLHTWM